MWPPEAWPEGRRAQTTAEDEPEPPAPTRRLPVALQNVQLLEFRDLDLDRGEIAGAVTWSPPAVITSIVGYRVYLADAPGPGAFRVLLGSAPVGTNHVTVEENTTTGGIMHMFVHSYSVLGESQYGTSVEVCDVSGEDTAEVTLASATSAPWGVVEVSLHADSRCADLPIAFAEIIAASNGSDASRAADGNHMTPWVSACGPCVAGAESLRFVGVCHPELVRCLRIQQCKADGSSNCPIGTARGQSLTLSINDEVVHTWTGLRSWSSLKGESLSMPGRRRRAAFGVSSEIPARHAQTTYCLGNPPNFTCANPPR